MMSDLIDATRNLVLGRLAEGSADKDALADLCLAFEAAMPGTRAGVTILGPSLERFENAIFPSLAPGYAEALKGIVVADRPGTCALAISEGRTVVSTDVAGDTRFSAAWRNLGVEHGLEAIVSVPIRRRDRTSIGTFVVAYPPHEGLRGRDLDTVDAFAEMCGLVLDRPKMVAEPDKADAGQA